MTLILCEGSGEIAFIYSYLKTKGYDIKIKKDKLYSCLLYTSDAADD